jgi:GTPase SAR1 family protein
VVVYDLTSEASFEIMSWVAELKSLGPRDIRLVIAANKCDCDERREVRAGENAHVHRLAVTR